MSFVLTLDKPRVAEAVVATNDVNAPAIPTNTLYLTLIPVITLIGVSISGLTLRTPTLKRAYRIYAQSAFAEMRDSLTLVDVCKNNEMTK